MVWWFAEVVTFGIPNQQFQIDNSLLLILNPFLFRSKGIILGSVWWDNEWNCFGDLFLFLFLFIFIFMKVSSFRIFEVVWISVEAIELRCYRFCSFLEVDLCFFAVQYLHSYLCNCFEDYQHCNRLPCYEENTEELLNSLQYQTS